MPKKELVIALPYLGKLALQVRIRMNRIMKKKNAYYTVISGLFSRASAKLVTFLHLKTKFDRSYVLTLFTSFSVVAEMPPIMAKLNVILSSKCVNT